MSMSPYPARSKTSLMRASSAKANGPGAPGSGGSGGSGKNGSAARSGTRNEGFPANVGSVDIEPIDGGRTRMSIESRYPSADAMAKFLAMGMEQGLTMAVGQIDAILAEGIAA